MAYRVSLAAPAETDAYAAFERIREAAPVHAEKWLTRLFEAIFSLGELSAHCPVIPEARELGYPSRHLLYNKREEDRCTGVRVWHASRHAITAADVKTLSPPSKRERLTTNSSLLVGFSP